MPFLGLIFLAAGFVLIASQLFVWLPDQRLVALGLLLALAGTLLIAHVQERRTDGHD